MKLVSYEHAKKAGLKRYFTGVPCKHGHICERHTTGKGCIECNLANVRKEREADVDRYNAAQRQYAADNKDRVAIYNKRWSDSHRKERNAYEAKRRSAKLKRTPAWADLNKIKQFYSDCPDGYTVDHVIPLRGELVSGLHVESILQYLTNEQNSRKGNRYAHVT